MRQKIEDWTTQESLTCTIAMCLMVECLVSRAPTVNPATAIFHSVTVAAATRSVLINDAVVNEGAQVLKPPLQPFNLFFVSGFTFIGGIRVDPGRAAPKAVLKKHFKLPLEEMVTKMLGAYVPQKRVHDDTRTQNKTKKTRLVILDDDDENIVPAGMALHLPPAIPHANEMASDNEEDEEPVEVRVTKLFKQMIEDLKKKAPNPKPTGSYYWANNDDVPALTFFKTELLQDVFRIVRVKTKAEEWARAIDFLVPPHPKKACQGAQGYHATRYYPAYLTLRGQCKTLEEQKSFENVRKIFIKNLDKLAWLPFAKSDRIWDTGKPTGKFTTLPENGEGDREIQWSVETCLRRQAPNSAPIRKEVTFALEDDLHRWA